MTPSQFNQIMERFQDMEARIRRLERWVATAGGAGAITVLYLGNKMISLGGLS